jgi:putative nucleotidyltransferase with HDIG domain
VDDETSVREGLNRMIFAMNPEWEADFASGGEQALEMLRKRPYDVVVTDMRMPGMDGAALLSMVQQNYPDMVRIVLSGHVDREMVLKTVRPAHQFLSKPCTPKQLREVVDSALALRSIQVDGRVRKVISRIESLPSLPDVYTAINDELTQEDPSLQYIGELISRDMGMSASILKVVNSAFFGFQRRITSPKQAVNLLGVDTIKGLILSAHIFTLLDFKGFPNFSIAKLWEHCMVTARMSRAIAEAQDLSPQEQDECFVAGLLHDVGKLVLAYHFPKAYRQVLNAVQSKNRNLWEVECEVMPATHAEIGAFMMGLWGLPLHVVSAIAFHHDPSRITPSGFSPLLAVHAANAFEHEMFVASPNMAKHPLDVECLEEAGLAGRIKAWRDHCGAVAREVPTK